MPRFKRMQFLQHAGTFLWSRNQSEACLKVTFSASSLLHKKCGAKDEPERSCEVTKTKKDTLSHALRRPWRSNPGILRKLLSFVKAMFHWPSFRACLAISIKHAFFAVKTLGPFALAWNYMLDGNVKPVLLLRCFSLVDFVLLSKKINILNFLAT